MLLKQPCALQQLGEDCKVLQRLTSDLEGGFRGLDVKRQGQGLDRDSMLSTFVRTKQPLDSSCGLPVHCRVAVPGLGSSVVYLVQLWTTFLICSLPGSFCRPL